MESKDMDSMSLATLFEKLQEHEMELQRLTLHEQMDENVKKISFKATKSHSRSQEGGFGKFHKEHVKESIKKSKNPNGNTSCHECGKVGHMKYTCPTYLKRIEHINKKDSRDINRHISFGMNPKRTLLQQAAQKIKNRAKCA
ncbi:hypothetical protein Lal_00018649 [Lupinus albus]|nr:hypothetical protein Lal_00018649 [Lupinus albus]